MRSSPATSRAWVTNADTGFTLHQNIGVAISASGNIRSDKNGLVPSVRGHVEELCPQLA